MMSESADKLRAAMRRLECELSPQPRLKLPTNKKRSFMFDVLIALGIVVVVAFIFSPAR